MMKTPDDYEIREGPEGVSDRVPEGVSDRIPEGVSDRVEAASGKMIPCGDDMEAAARIPADELPGLLEALRDGPGRTYDMLTDVTAVDEERTEHRFDVIYHLRSTKTGGMIRIKVFAEGDPPEVPSAVDIYPTADWHEREVYDMLGIRFEGHPDLKRILMPLDYEGNPLRKDFPLEGVEPDRLYRRLYPE